MRSMTVLLHVCFVAGLLISPLVTSAYADDLAELVAAEQQYDTSSAVGRFSEAQVAAKKMLAIVNRSFADKPKMMAACLERLAMAYHQDGKNAEAEPIQKRALAMYEDYAAALHRAKRWVRQKEKWASPYYWGTFVLVGPS
jgi:tetratricopeptide (TPR) repeat protein